MILKTQIAGYRIKFVFRHRWENKEPRHSIFEWSDYQLGLWFKRYDVVSKPRKGPAILGKNGTTSKSYMLGIKLIICKAWVDICHRPLELNTNQK
jgi:hypothetical protein